MPVASSRPAPRRWTPSRISSQWCRVAAIRERLKGNAIAHRATPGAGGALTASRARKPPHPLKASRRAIPLRSVDEQRFLDLEARLHAMADDMVGWRFLVKLEKLAAKYQPARPSGARDPLMPPLLAHQVAPRKAPPRDEVARMVAETPVGACDWYVGGKEREERVHALLRPWTAVRAARAVLLARVRRGLHGAQRARQEFDRDLVSFWEGSRIAKQMDALNVAHLQGHLDSAHVDVLESLISRDRDFDVQVARARKGGSHRLSARALTVLQSRPANGWQGDQFERVRWRAFEVEHAAAVKSVAALFRCTPAALLHALRQPSVQTADRGDGPLRLLQLIAGTPRRSVQRHVSRARAAGRPSSKPSASRSASDSIQKLKNKPR